MANPPSRTNKGPRESNRTGQYSQIVCRRRNANPYAPTTRVFAQSSPGNNLLFRFGCISGRMNERADSDPRRLEDFAEIASDWFWESNEEHRFTFFSGRIKTVLQLDPRDLLGVQRTDLAHQRDRDSNWQAHLSDLDAKRPFKNFEYSILRPTDGVEKRLRISGKPCFDADNNFVGYRGTGNDITAEHEAIEKLKQSNAALALRNEELIDMRRALERSINEDFLTRLLNRAAFERDVDEALGVPDNQVILLHIDLDRFKWINDSLGYPAGDCVLTTVADRLRHIASGVGPVYRVGGNEFQIVLADNADMTAARWIADSILEIMEAPIALGSQEVSVGASVGIAFGIGRDLTTRQLISNADIALHTAKSSGRGCVRELTPDLHAEIAARRHLASELPRAIEDSQIIPFYQPQIHARTGQVIGAEALARWQHPKLGLLPPAAFLDIAAELGLLAAIDRSMMKQALQFSSEIAARGANLPAVSVNLSAGRLIDPLLVKDIESCWTDRSCVLAIELLETISFDELQEDTVVNNNLMQLRKMGVQIETDDFGSGRASITSLLNIQPDRIKIDRHLVQGAINDPVKRKVVSAILEMTRAMGIEALAEGVETTNDIDVIRALGCDLFQGYAYARPLSEDDFCKYLNVVGHGTAGQLTVRSAIQN